MPDLREQAPRRIAAGFGGTLNLVISAIYIVLVVMLTALPCHFFLAWRESSWGSTWLAAVLGGAAGVGRAGRGGHGRADADQGWVRLPRPRTVNRASAGRDRRGGRRNTVAEQHGRSSTVAAAPVSQRLQNGAVGPRQRVVLSPHACRAAATCRRTSLDIR